MQPGIRSSASDLELLREFEPIVRYTRGESFFPMDVERYVEESGLWLHHPGDRDRRRCPRQFLRGPAG